MKKLLLIAVAVLTVMTASAQVTVKGSKPLDNFSFTIKGGMVSPFQGYAFWPSARGIVGAEIRKQITPVWGLGVEGEWTINTSSWQEEHSVWGPHSANWFDHQFVGLFGTWNLTNAVWGYKGSPRTIELEAVASAGWWHAYRTGEEIILGGEGTVKYPDENSWYSKFGANANFNLGKNKAVTLSLKPAVLWYMGQGYSRGTTAYNANRAIVEIEAGLTYHFGNSNGTHHFVLCDKQYTQEDIDVLNAQINDLRGDLDAQARQLAAARAQIDDLEGKLADCLRRGPEVVVNEVDNSVETLETNVFFKVGKSVVNADQMPNVERVAIFLKNHKDATVSIKGYASPEGSIELNTRLANDRAAAVRNLLINKYKIAANRIQAEGQGIGNMFSEPEWNRVSICIISNPKE
ncbi:MAG: OmpA family protein [Muribaculaceae bacterium]|nr:OmpA family protein [Muribaculaceae bacterium]